MFTGILYLIYYFAITLWYVYLILGAIFLFIARAWIKTASSTISKAGSGFLIFFGLSIFLMGLYGAYIQLDDKFLYNWRMERKYRKLNQTHKMLLEEDMCFDEIILTKGTVVRWNNRFDIKRIEEATINNIWWVALPESKEILGYTFDKDWNLYFHLNTIKGHLAEKKYIQSLPIYREVTIDNQGKLIQGQIAKNTKFHGQEIAKDSKVSFEKDPETQLEYLRVIPCNKTLEEYRIEINPNKDD